jgi:hypothetical protein
MLCFRNTFGYCHEDYISLPKCPGLIFSGKFRLSILGLSFPTKEYSCRLLGYTRHLTFLDFLILSQVSSTVK